MFYGLNLTLLRYHSLSINFVTTLLMVQIFQLILNILVPLFMVFQCTLHWVVGFVSLMMNKLIPTLTKLIPPQYP